MAIQTINDGEQGSVVRAKLNSNFAENEASAAAAQSSADAKLASVATDETLSGDGTGGSPLSVNGQFGFASSADFSRPGQTTEGLINQQNAVLEDYLQLQFTADRSKPFEISASLAWSLDSTTQNFISQLEISGDRHKAVPTRCFY